MTNLSVVVLTKNEEKNIIDCLDSIKLECEIILIDDFSKDRTIEVAKKFNQNIKIFKRKLMYDFSKQRNFGLSKVSNEWVLFLDADERLSNFLIEEIKYKIKLNTHIGYRIKRIDTLWNKRLLYGESGNIQLLRLGKKSSGKWVGKVHEKWEFVGKVGVLENSLLHFPHQYLSEFIHEINYYSTIRANELFESKTRISVVSIISYPLAKFLLIFIFKKGFLDGIPGLIFAVTMSFHSFLVRSKLWLLVKNNE